MNKVVSVRKMGWWGPSVGRGSPAPQPHNLVGWEVTLRLTHRLKAQPWTVCPTTSHWTLRDSGRHNQPVRIIGEASEEPITAVDGNEVFAQGLDEFLPSTSVTGNLRVCNKLLEISWLKITHPLGSPRVSWSTLNYMFSITSSVLRPEMMRPSDSASNFCHEITIEKNWFFFSSSLKRTNKSIVMHCLTSVLYNHYWETYDKEEYLLLIKRQESFLWFTPTPRGTSSGEAAFFCPVSSRYCSLTFQILRPVLSSRLCWWQVMCRRGDGSSRAVSPMETFLCRAPSGFLNSQRSCPASSAPPSAAGLYHLATFSTLFTLFFLCPIFLNFSLLNILSRTSSFIILVLILNVFFFIYLFCTSVKILSFLCLSLPSAFTSTQWIISTPSICLSLFLSIYVFISLPWFLLLSRFLSLPAQLSSVLVLCFQLSLIFSSLCLFPQHSLR